MTTVIAETESDLSPELVEKLRGEIADFYQPGVKVEVRANVPGAGFQMWGMDYKLPTCRQVEVL